MKTNNNLLGKKVMVLINKVDTLFSFRMPLISLLQEKGCEVIVVTTERVEDSFGKRHGIHVESCFLPNRSTNPFKLLRYSTKIEQIVKRVKPDIIFCFQLLINIFGTFGVKKYLRNNPDCKLIVTIEGIGEAFAFKTLKWFLIRTVTVFLYKKALKYPNIIYFLNNDDYFEFVNRKIASPKKSKIINGIGVDINKYIFKEKDTTNHSIRIGMISRLIKLKGIIDYCKIARFIHSKYPSYSFFLYGEESEYGQKDLISYIEDGSVSYLGNVKDMTHIYSNLTFVMLCSKREGCPVSIMEGMASGCIPIVNDAPGCRNMVKDEWNNGLIIDTGDESNYKLILDFIMSKTKNDILTLSKKNREIVEEFFNAKTTQETVVNDIELLYDDN